MNKFLKITGSILAAAIAVLLIVMFLLWAFEEDNPPPKISETKCYKSGKLVYHQAYYPDYIGNKYWQGKYKFFQADMCENLRYRTKEFAE